MERIPQQRKKINKNILKKDYFCIDFFGMLVYNQTIKTNKKPVRPTKQTPAPIKKRKVAIL
jgi:hypothetical protein